MESNQDPHDPHFFINLLTNKNGSEEKENMPYMYDHSYQSPTCKARNCSTALGRAKSYSIKESEFQNKKKKKKKKRGSTSVCLGSVDRLCI